MVDSFAVIAEPRRRQILDVLRTRNASVSELVELLAISQPAVSKHLKVLRDNGLVTVEPQGQQRIYRIDPGPLQTIDEWLATYRVHWRDSFDRLDAHLATTRSSPETRSSR